MGFVYTCGVCIFCMSVWAVIQLTLMGFFYSIEGSTMIHDVSPSKYNGTVDFLLKVKENYQLVSNNCYYAAYSYVVIVVLSWFIIFQGKILDKKAAEKRLGETCTPLLA